MPAGQIAIGFSLSFTVIVNEQELVLLFASVAVQFTVVMPMENVLPEGGVHNMVAPAQLSEAVAE